MYTYKESGIAWIGKIPAHWEVSKLKYLITICNGKDYRDIEVQDGGFPVIGSGGEFARANKYIYNKESVLFGRKGTIDKPLYYDSCFWTTDTMFFSKMKSANAKYIYYYATQFKYDYYMTSTALPSMTQNDLNSIRLAVPPLSEQKRIACFLDTQCDTIDSVIEKIEKQKELLKAYKKSLIAETVSKGLNKNAKRKESGIAWIGKIPAHWEVSKLKYTTDILMGQSPESDDIIDEHGKYLFMQGNAEFGKIHPQPNKYCNNPKKLSRLNDILMSVRAPVGALNISNNVYAIGRGLCSILAKKIDTKYLWYFLNKSKDDFLYYSNGSTFEAITIENLINFPILVPPLSEQKQIAKFLDEQCSKIDSIIAKKERQSQLMKEYKKSLIYEYVTGKKQTEESHGNSKR